MEMQVTSSGGLTARAQLRDWLGTRVPRHVFSRLPQVVTRCSVSPGQHSLTLTFDDGPHPLGTPKLLEKLRQHQVAATFFLLGERAQRWPELVRQILDEGHQIGNHSWAHADFWKCSKRQLLIELSRTQQLLESLSGRPVPWMRPPYGHVTYTARAWARRRHAMVALWDVLPPDYNPGSDLPRLKRILNQYLRPGSVVCLHDNDVSINITPQLLEDVIPKLKSTGWSFQNLK